MIWVGCLHDYRALGEEPASSQRVVAEIDPEEISQEALISAIRVRNAEKVKQLLKAGVNASIPVNGVLAVNLAARQGSFVIFKLLIAQHVRVTNDTLLGAAAGGNLDCVRYLVENGLNVNYSGPNLWTPLGMAATSGNKAVLEFLLGKGAHLDAKDQGGGTPLMLSILGGSLEVTKLLVAQGADLTVRDGNGYTLLAGAVEYDQFEMARYFLQQGVDPNIPNIERKLPLDIAREKGNTKMIELLKSAMAERVKPVR
jgi:ankyrin repeat protein